MALTIEDVFALTELPLSGEILSPNLRQCITPVGLITTLRWLPDRLVTNGILYRAMVEHIGAECEHFKGRHMIRREIWQLSRCYLLLLFHD